MVKLDSLDELRSKADAFRANASQKGSPDCKCCLNSSTVFIGDVDFSKSCADGRITDRVFEVSSVFVPYYQCSFCGFVFTNFADDWTDNDFSTFVYNDQYCLADPPPRGFEGSVKTEDSPSYKVVGPHIMNSLGIKSEQSLRLLDYGSGGDPGPTAKFFSDNGFVVDGYEPFRATDGKQLRFDKYDVIYSIEVFEHVTDLKKLAIFLSNYLSETGILFVQTLLHPHPTDASVLDSWYISPRNGHFSIFSFMSLFLFLKMAGINLVHTPLGYVGIKDKPSFQQHIFI